MSQTPSEALPELPTSDDVQRALDAGEAKTHTEVLGVLTGQVPVRSMPVAMDSDDEAPVETVKGRRVDDDDTSES